MPCPAGQFCNETGLTGPSESCNAGYLCIANATSAAPDDGVNGPCPPGYYCEQGKQFSIFIMLIVQKLKSKSIIKYYLNAEFCER